MRIRHKASFLRRLTIAAAGMMAFVLLGASPAAAHVVADGVFTYRSNENCVYERAEISHGDGNGYARADVESQTWLSWPGVQCAYPYERPAGYMANKIQLMAWNGSSWFLCAETDWVYNQTVTNVFVIESRMIGSPICGFAYYGTNATGYVWNNAWYGGTVWSGAHALPALAQSAMEAPTDYPEQGDTVGVLDASGNPVLDADGAPVTVVVGEAPNSTQGPTDDEAEASASTEDGAEYAEVPMHAASERITL